ncbi:MAG: exopolysaccharide biosynthesis polyprenyl glycosylphosphotransferase [Acidimicrobiales bacterium]|nr:exopolysaccharide biosynthesis polyprenyl glycosylphosphotransferase [Acidimicrobiales bacterium]
MLRANHHTWKPRSAYCDGSTKRAFDVAVAGLLAIATFPVVVVLAIGSAVAFRAWPFFVQERIGRDGRPFHFVKIRSLPTTTPRYADKYALAEIRNTTWGRLLRASHLDELPQLWLVLAGHMSLVGPRPEMAEVAEQFDRAFVAARTTVRPGCTGPWQVSESATGLIGEDPRFDLYYLDEARFGLDLRVLWLTFAQLLGAGPLTFDRLQGSFEDHVGELTLDHPAGDDVIDLTDHNWFRTQLLDLFSDSFEPLATAVD